jgi:5-methylcytosine-specific restriction enzyme subunit McrC
MQIVELREASTEAYLSLEPSVAAEIARLGIGSIYPLAGGQWRMSAIGKVGTLRIDNVELRIAPKVPIERLFYLLGRGREWGTWFEDEIKLSEVADFVSAIAQVFVIWAGRVLRQAPVKDYLTVERSEPTIRGRWLVREQLRRRHGLPHPAEVEYDEYTMDVPANRLIRSAGRRLLRAASLPSGPRSALRRIDAVLADAELLTPGVALPQVRFDRRNDRYRPIVALAELILTNGSLDSRVGAAPAAGFLIDLSRVFEQFIEAEVIRACAPFGGTVRPQFSSHLDRDHHVTIQPDLVWIREGSVATVFDAKYKAEKPSGYPNADIYQMITYCARHRLTRGHLIYAAGNEGQRRIVVEEAGIEVVCHSVALDRSPAEISAQIDVIVAESSRGFVGAA